MKVLTCAGYYKSGSSAVADLMSEFDNVHSFGNYEFGLLKSRDGIADLEYNLVDNVHRVNSGYAIKKYMENVKIWRGNIFFPKCEKMFNNQFSSISSEYARRLTAFTYRGYYPVDLRDRGKVYYCIDRTIYHVARRLGGFLYKGSDRQGRPVRQFKIHLLKRNNVYLPRRITREEFLNYTKEYLNRLFCTATDKEYVMVDQMIPVNNYERYSRYFDNVKCVVVDRDPRDVFVYVKHVLNERNVPYKRVEEFCEWYKFSHELVEKSKDVLYINFEDLVLHYDEYSKKIIDFYGIDEVHHINKNRYLQPEVSCHGIGMWKKYPKEAENIRYIEEHLEEYLYSSDR